MGNKPTRSRKVTGSACSNYTEPVTELQERPVLAPGVRRPRKIPAVPRPGTARLGRRPAAARSRHRHHVRASQLPAIHWRGRIPVGAALRRDPEVAPRSGRGARPLLPLEGATPLVVSEICSHVPMSWPEANYSERRAVRGFTRVALRAGSQHAISAVPKSAAVAMTKEVGSSGLTS